MENSSSIERVVGKIPDQEKTEILQGYASRFDEQVFEELKGKEREKTPEELQMIALANDITNEIRRKYGLDDFDIPEKNIHLIARDKWIRDEEIAGVYNSKLQGIALKEQTSRMALMHTIFHELVHFKSYNALQVTTGDSPELQEYRVGLTIQTRDGKELNFVNLNEAVTEELTKRYSEEYFSDPLFNTEKDITNTIVNQHSNATLDNGQPLFNTDTYFANIVSVSDTESDITSQRFTFPTEREVLKILMDKILEKNPDQFRDEDEVFEVFAKAMMTGNILPLGRLIETTFSKGTLRSIATLDHDVETQKEFVLSL